MLTQTELAACRISRGIVLNTTKKYPTDDRSPRYMAFLLRLWCVDVEENAAWRASLEDARTGERHGFASLDRLAAFLEGQCQSADRELIMQNEEVE